jgi:hypothetical protein
MKFLPSTLHPQRWWLVGIALLVTLLNAFKPLTIDDGPYYYYAAHIAEHPGDPYGFQFMGWQPAHETLAPLVLPYWWGGAIHLFGDRPFLWKLALFPFSLMLTFALHALFRRFAPGLELPLVLMTAASPALLPSWNLMLDLPALSLALGGLVVYLRASDRGSLTWASAAGILVGLAMQTKYTAFVPLAAIVGHALLTGKIREGLVTAGVAVLLFVAWEMWLRHSYGASHFLFHVQRQQGQFVKKLRLILPLLSTLGGVAPFLALLALAALGASRRIVWTGLALMGLGYTLLAVVPERWQVLAISAEAGQGRIALAGILYGVSGAIVVGALLRVIWRLGRGERYLILWMILEVAGYMVLSPFPAVRRALGVFVVGVLLAGRLASRTCRRSDRLALVQGISLAGLLLGLGFYGVDLWEARTRQMAAESAAQWVRDRDPGARIWFIGTHGFQFYAERSGMRRHGTGPHPLPGDWLIVDDDNRQAFPGMTPETELVWEDSLPLRTFCCFYASGAPLEHLEGPRCTIAVYRPFQTSTPVEAPAKTLASTVAPLLMND